MLHPPSKKNKARHSSTSICNIVQDNNGIVVLNSHINAAEDIDSSRQDINLDLDSNSVSSTTSVASIVSGENSTDNLPTEYESDDNSSVNHQFVNDSKVYSNFLSQVDTEINFALTLSFTRTPRLLRNAEDVIIIFDGRILLERVSKKHVIKNSTSML